MNSIDESKLNGKEQQEKISRKTVRITLCSTRTKKKKEMKLKVNVLFNMEI